MASGIVYSRSADKSTIAECNDVCISNDYAKPQARYY